LCQRLKKDLTAFLGDSALMHQVSHQLHECIGSLRASSPCLALHGDLELTANQSFALVSIIFFFWISTVLAGHRKRSAAAICHDGLGIPEQRPTGAV